MLKFEIAGALKTKNGSYTKDVVLSAMTGREQDILAEGEKNNEGEFVRSIADRLIEILSRCTVSIGADTRPEGQTRKSHPFFFKEHWSEAFLENRNHALFKLREVSVGPKMRFDDVCKHCGKTIQGIEVDFSKAKVESLPIEEASKSEIELMVGGHLLRWRMFTSKDEAVITELRRTRKRDFISAVLWERLLTINNEPKDVFGTDFLLDELSHKDRLTLRKSFDRFGIDPSVQVTCPHCGRESSYVVDPGHESFFFPSEV